MGLMFVFKDNQHLFGLPTVWNILSISDDMIIFTYAIFTLNIFPDLRFPFFSTGE